MQGGTQACPPSTSHPGGAVVVVKPGTGATQLGCRRLYAGSPAKIYTVMRVDCILGPAHIVADPVHRTIPHASVYTSKLEHGRADTRVGSHNGSELFRLNRWTTTWGSESALPADWHDRDGDKD